MVLAELQQVAGGLGIKGTARMRKSELIDAITTAQPGPAGDPSADRGPGAGSPAGDTTSGARGRSRDRTRSDGRAEAATRAAPRQDTRPAGRQAKTRARPGGHDDRGRATTGRTTGTGAGGQDRQPGQRQPQPTAGVTRRRAVAAVAAAAAATATVTAVAATATARDSEPPVLEDDVLLPVAGILDVLDNYAFVRTSGYLPGPDDVYVSLSMVRKYGLRKGDAVTGQVKQSASRPQGEVQPAGAHRQRQRTRPRGAKQRLEFSKLTPLYAQERLRLETEAPILTTRVIDIVAPIGKGQRGLIVSPSKAGKTLVLQSIANAITTNNPECHLMVVLVDERPEEVTDMQRAVKGEVIASTFDRPADDHTTVAELAIERAKRLVELGPRRRRAARLDHPAGPGVQPGRAGQRPDPVRWRRLVGALPARSGSSVRRATSRTAAR